MTMQIPALLFIEREKIGKGGILVTAVWMNYNDIGQQVYVCSVSKVTSAARGGGVRRTLGFPVLGYESFHALLKCGQSTELWRAW